MNLKIFLLNILFYLKINDFVKSFPNNSPNTEFTIYNSFKQPPNNSANNSDLILSDVNKIELKIETIINEKMQEINKGLIDNTNYMEKFISNAFNNIEFRMKSLITEKMANIDKELDSANNREKMELKMELLNEKIDKMNKELTTFINNSKLQGIINHNYKCSNIVKPRSCNDFKGCDSSIYNLMLPEVSNKTFLASCDLKTDGGGWTIIQRRQDGSENFYRNWNDYAEGFGDVNGDFFLGLNKIHALTSFEPQELYIMLEDFEGVKKYAKYGEFKIDSESNDFILTVRQYSGNAGDSLTQHNNMKFTTRDRDNDENPNDNCAKEWESAWWYNWCFKSDLNGQYYTPEQIKTKRGVNWYTFSNGYTSLKFVQMMLRPKEN